MSELRDIKSAIDPEFGMVKFVAVHQKPLWFSDTKSAVAFSSNASGAISLVKAEINRKENEDRIKKVPGEGASKGMGLGFSYEETIMKAVCECIERSCGRCAIPGKHKIVYDSYDSLKLRGNIHPLSTWEILTEEQYQNNINWRPNEDIVSERLILKKLLSNTKINWVSLKESGQEKFWWIPVQAAFLGFNVYDEGKEDEIAIVEPISTGMACGQSAVEATLSGIYEVIERDAIMGMWINRLSPPMVDLSGASIKRNRLRRIIKELNRTKYEIIVSDLTNDFDIPTYFATLFYDEVPYTIVGAGCHHEPEIAIEKALMEIMMALSAFAQLEIPEKIVEADDEILAMHDHANIYMFKDYRKRLDFLRSSRLIGISNAKFLGRPNEEILSDIVRIVNSKGFQVLVNDVTLPEIEDLGLTVVKVIIPGLLPLNNLHRNAANGSRRITDYLRLYDKEFEFDDPINPWPHPFP